MKIGLIVRANERGLGQQSWEFYRHLKPHKTVAVSLAGDSVKTFEKYPDAYKVMDVVCDDAYEHFSDCDVVLSFETFYNDRAVQAMQAKGVKFILQPNYEQQANIEVADGIIAPSVWYFNDWRHSRKTYLPVPVDRERLPFKLRSQAKVFIHNAGTQFGDDRNGTIILLEAMKYVKSDIRLIVHIQKLSEMLYNKVVELAGNDKRIELDTQTFDNYYDLWREGDVFVYPRTYGGLALPTAEAMSVGMPVIMPCISPQQEYLPNQLLVQPSGLKTAQGVRGAIQHAIVDPHTLADKIDEIAGQDKTVIENLSRQMDKTVENWNWTKLLPKYKATLKQYVDHKR